MFDLITFGVTITAGATLIVVAWLLTVLGVAGRLAWLRYTVLPLVMTGFGGVLAASLFGISIGGLINALMTKIAQFSAHVAPALAYIIPIALGLVAAGFFVNGVWTGEVSTRHVVAACAVPVTVGSIPGAVGAFFIALFGFFPVGLVLWFYNLAFAGIGRVF